MKFALGENPKSVYNDRKETPVTRGHRGPHPGAPGPKAQEYQDKQAKADGDPDQTCPITTPSWRRWCRWWRGAARPLHAHRADDIATGA